MLLITLLVINIGCKNQRASKSGHDNIMVDTIYFETGEVKKINQYKNNNLNGLCLTFHTNGSIKFKSEYKSGVKSGKTEIFNENGILIQSGYYLGGQQFGGANLYNEDGQIILYKCTDYSKNMFFKINYFDPDFEITSSSELFSRIFFTAISDDTLMNKKEIFFLIAVADPPGYTLKFYLHEVTDEGKIIRTKEKMVVNNSVNLNNYFIHKQGDLNLLFEALLYDSKGQLVKRDTLVKHYYVKNYKRQY